MAEPHSLAGGMRVSGWSHTEGRVGLGEHLWAYGLAKDAALSQARFIMAAQCWR